MRQGTPTGRLTSKQTWEAESGKRKAVVCWTCGKNGQIARVFWSHFSPSVERAYHVREEGSVDCSFSCTHLWGKLLCKGSRWGSRY